MPESNKYYQGRLLAESEFEFQVNLKEIMVICCALESFNYVLRKCLEKETNKKLIRYIKSYIKFQKNLIKDFNNEVYR